MRGIGSLLAGLVLLVALSPARADELVLRHPDSDPGQPWGFHALEVLRLALDRTTATHGPARLESVAGIPAGRAVVALSRARRIDVMAAETGLDLESLLTAVRFPLVRGLFGYRLAVIRAGEETRFAACRTLADLRRFSLGLVLDVAAVGLYRRNGFEVETAVDRAHGLGLLSRRRADFMPVAIDEVDAADPVPGLRLEPTLTLYRPAPVYLFVDRRRPDLADRLAEGLEAALADGSFDALFRDTWGGVIERAGLERRRMLPLDDPEVPFATPLERPELWYRPGDLTGTGAAAPGRWSRPSRP